MRPYGGPASSKDGPRPPSSGGISSSTKPTANGTARTFVHITDLKRQALAGYNRHGNIHQLLQTAEGSLGQAGTLLDFGRPDLSYAEYLRAAQIVVEEIPRHMQWADFQMDRDGGFQRYSVLQKRINGKSEQYASIKETIVANNARSGVRPKGGDDVSNSVAPRADVPNSNGLTSANGTTAEAEGRDGVHKGKPSPLPKPDRLHGNVVSSGPDSNAGSTLNERFARLRTMQTNNGAGASGSGSAEASSQQKLRLAMPNANDYRVNPAPTIPLKPKGPREMPGDNTGPAIPAKVLLDADTPPAMPKAPSPTYSPARNMQITGNIAPPRYTARSLAPTSTRRTTTIQASPVSTHSRSASSDYSNYSPATSVTFSAEHREPPKPPPSRRKSVHVPKETIITAERLYDYLKYFSILLIDFRPREEFDQGHILHRTIINVDPHTLSSGMSASELLDRMILSPDNEQECFMSRSTYDLVVYYDYDTRTEQFLHRPETEKQMKLKYLHEALYEYNQDSPLLRPPILLAGGIDAWTDLVGQQALATSNTAALTKLAPGLRRRPAVTPKGNSQLSVARTRLRDYNPLDEDEERNWRERARAESVVLPPAYETAHDPAYGDDDSDKSEAAIQEFLQRFPEAGSLEVSPFMRSMSPPIRAPPEIPAKVPIYPPPPPSSQFHAVPARPPPAAARPSYTGVSEKLAAQTTPGVRSGQLAPYVPPKYLATNLRLPKTGLHNFGQTCYMNATIQALSATTPLSIFFLDNRFMSMLQRDNWKGTKGVMPELFSNLIRNMWKGDVTYIRPSTLRAFCGRLKKEWGNNDQQDAKEFFDFVVDCLHEDLNSMWARTPLRALTPQEEAKRERMPKQIVAKTEWDRYTHREQSYLTDLMGGQHLSRLRCSHCGWTSTTYEAFYSISVEIPKQGSYSGQFPTLDDCFRSYCKEESLTGEDGIKCEGSCKAIRDGTKQILITRVPQCLVVHFKRFSTNAYGRPASKIRTPVEFPLQAFNLEPYVLPQPSPAELAFIQQNYSSYMPEPCMTPPYTYDAYSVVRHIGVSLQSGHYTTAVKDRARGVWRYFNDERAEDFQPGQSSFRGHGDLRNEQAYIVFYQRNMPTAAAAAAETAQAAQNGKI